MSADDRELLQDAQIAALQGQNSYLTNELKLVRAEYKAVLELLNTHTHEFTRVWAALTGDDGK